MKNPQYVEIRKHKTKSLPDHTLDTLRSSFQNTSQIKIARVRSHFVINHNDYDFHEEPPPATTNGALITTKQSPTKSCALDPFPTFLLKSCINQVIFS